MNRNTLHQFVAGAGPGDAITDQALMMRRWLRELGFASDIYSEHVHPELASEVKPVTALRLAGNDSWLIVHQSIGTPALESALATKPNLIVVYHNVTPPEFFRAADSAMVEALTIGRKQLLDLQPLTRLAIGVSAYNVAELETLGFQNTGIVPIALDESRYRSAADRATPNELSRRIKNLNGPKLLFVGRIAPNKRQEDLLKLLHYLRRIEPEAHLFLVGEKWQPAYTRWLNQLSETLELRDAVTMTGRVDQEQLVSYFRSCDLYISMSEHEGFGKPFIESMYFDLPIVAYRSTGVPGTLGNSGILFNEKNYEALAEMVDILLKDSRLRERIITQQKSRVQKFLEPAVKQSFYNHLSGLGIS